MKRIGEKLEQRKDQGRLRGLRTMDCSAHPWVTLAGRGLVNFSSNDYLGLAGHPLLQERGAQFAALWGAGSRASRLVCGNHPGYEAVEAKLARLKGTQAALVFNSGYQANISVVTALAGRGDMVLMDRLIHNSLIQGGLLCEAKVRRFRHNDLEHLSQLLETSSCEPGGQVFVVAETVYSMDGDRPDLAGLVELTKCHGAFLILDEAHATGVLGPQGMGLSVGLGADLVIGTFGKGLGSFGAYLAGSQELMDYMVNFCGGLIYTTALPPWALGAIDAALDLVPGMQAEREHLAEMAQSLRRGLKGLGFDCLASDSQIVPLVVGQETDCLDLANYLEEQGYLAMAIRPPTVEEGKARIRLALSAAHEAAQVQGILKALKDWRALGH
ncbi:MAG: 8-amino-7-oxononanoate synthase [bacterium]|nr:8-amino-7-oxononanoate synthase [bacterium]